ncbi:MAG: antibiotic biosynthesis monooxygenase [Micromonosporaceae bacterium]
MLVVSRFRVDPARADDFTVRAHTALAALAARPGYRSGRFGRSLDEPEYWCLVTEWESVGTYRRALSAYEVKLNATPLLAEAVDEPSAYEVLASADPQGEVVVMTSDRASEPHR